MASVVKIAKKGVGYPAAIVWLSCRQALLLTDVTDYTEMPLMLPDHTGL